MHKFICTKQSKCLSLENTDPMATAPAIDKPSAADFPRPLAAVMVTVVLNVFSAIASMNFTTAFAYMHRIPACQPSTSK